MNVFRRAPWVLTIALLLALSVNVFARSSQVHALTLLVVPERFNIVQVSFDIIAKRPVALVSYRGDASTKEPVLHAWTGDQWWPISMEEYHGGHFLIQQPSRIILVGDDQLLPLALVEASDWGPLVMSIDTLQTDELLNAVGRLMEFSRAEWRWFARRYNMDIEDLSAPGERLSWYDQMTRARQVPQPRHIEDDRSPVPIVPAPAEPMIVEQPTPKPERTRSREPVRRAPVQSAPTSDAPVPIVEATEWPVEQDRAPAKRQTDDASEGLIK